MTGINSGKLSRLLSTAKQGDENALAEGYEACRFVMTRWVDQRLHEPAIEESWCLGTYFRRPTKMLKRAFQISGGNRHSSSSPGSGRSSAAI